MCELLGLAFNRPVSPGLSFRGFRHRARRNRDGWGLAAISPERTRITKEPINAEESDTAAALPDRERAARARRDGPAAIDPLTDYPALEDFLRDLNALGNLNLLFSDGRRLFCYHDEGGYNGLAWTRRETPFSSVSLRDEDWEAKLAEEKTPDQRGYVIASRPLTDGEDWRACRPGRLLVIERGTAVFGE